MHGSQSQTSPPFTKRNMNMTYQCHRIYKEEHESDLSMSLYRTTNSIEHYGRMILPLKPISLRSHSKIQSPFLHSFLHLNLRCKQELVASACGVDTGLFAFHVSKLLMIQRLRKSKCFLPKHHSFDREYHNQDKY